MVIEFIQIINNERRVTMAYRKANLTSMWASYTWNVKQYKKTGHARYKNHANIWYSTYKKFGGKRKRII